MAPKKKNIQRRRRYSPAETVLIWSFGKTLDFKPREENNGLVEEWCKENGFNNAEGIKRKITQMGSGEEKSARSRTRISFKRKELFQDQDTMEITIASPNTHKKQKIELAQNPSTLGAPSNIVQPAQSELTSKSSPEPLKQTHTVAVSKEPTQTVEVSVEPTQTVAVLEKTQLQPLQTTTEPITPPSLEPKQPERKTAAASAVPIPSSDPLSMSNLTLQGNKEESLQFAQNMKRLTVQKSVELLHQYSKLELQYKEVQKTKVECLKQKEIVQDALKQCDASLAIVISDEILYHTEMQKIASEMNRNKVYTDMFDSIINIHSTLSASASSASASSASASSASASSASASSASASSASALSAST